VACAGKQRACKEAGACRSRKRHTRLPTMFVWLKHTCVLHPPHTMAMPQLALLLLFRCC
jgi:hypothetical protein